MCKTTGIKELNPDLDEFEKWKTFVNPDDYTTTTTAATTTTTTVVYTFRRRIYLTI